MNGACEIIHVNNPIKFNVFVLYNRPQLIKIKNQMLFYSLIIILIIIKNTIKDYRVGENDI